MTSKIYTVMKDGEELKTYKSLGAAKALAEREGAEVFSGNDCVYAPDPLIGGWPVVGRNRTDDGQKRKT